MGNPDRQSSRKSPGGLDEEHALAWLLHCEVEELLLTCGIRADALENEHHMRTHSWMACGAFPPVAPLRSRHIRKLLRTVLDSGTLVGATCSGPQNRIVRWQAALNATFHNAIPLMPVC